MYLLYVQSSNPKKHMVQYGKLKGMCTLDKLTVWPGTLYLESDPDPSFSPHFPVFCFNSGISKLTSKQDKLVRLAFCPRYSLTKEKGLCDDARSRFVIMTWSTVVSMSRTVDSMVMEQTTGEALKADDRIFSGELKITFDACASWGAEQSCPWMGERAFYILT